MSILAIIGCSAAIFTVTKFVADALLRRGNLKATCLLNLIAGAATTWFIVINAPSFWAGVGCYFAAAFISVIISNVVYALMPKREGAYDFA